MSAPIGYALTAKWLHWLSAPAIVGAIGTVLYAQTLEGDANKPLRGQVMFVHKSLGTAAGLLLVPRVAAAVLMRKPPPLAEASALERAAAGPAHLAMYAFSAVMAGTGIYMGLAGGSGLPFFVTTIPAWKTLDKPGAKQAYDIHTLAGYWGKALVPLHVGAALSHYARGHKVFARINPFAKA